MTIYDITVPLSPLTPVWPGDPPILLEQVSSMDAGDHDNVSRLTCSVHSGTHVDAPHHFLNDHRTVEKLPLDVLIGSALVIHAADDVELISADFLDQANIPVGTERLLIKTRNSNLWKSMDTEFYKKFVGIRLDGAEWLVRRGFKLVGIDYLSVAPYHQSIPTHQVLLKPGIVLLEGLDLSAVSPGSYDLYCLPLKLSGSDGAPARAILVDK
jgi:arylformamidase